jgi:hypothetical protein
LEDAADHADSLTTLPILILPMPWLLQSSAKLVLPDQETVWATTWVQPLTPEKLPL